jgi:4-aminobutyrate aminotransferase/diaminobutyrate-pyruvate transaminase/4-aminobutyrate aminotransferase/(S)-3-amino-2-methylpropionate transaminase
MTLSYEFEPREVPKVKSKYREINTMIPVPESRKIIEQLRKYEARSMSGQPLVIWDRAESFQVYDNYGNKWIDFSSGVLVANSGHGNVHVRSAIIEQVKIGLLHNYCFPSEIRAKLVELLSKIAPSPLEKVFLLTTGSETTECAIKLSRSYGQKIGGRKKIKIITFNDSFHGRTLGAQMAGGSPPAKEWIVNLDPDIIQVPFPNAFYYKWADDRLKDYDEDVCFEHFLENLKEKNIEFESIAGIMSETFQGGWVQLMPKGFANRLREFCDRYKIVLTFDEVQTGFGRTGKMFGFQYYNITPDLVCCGKGITSSMPLSSVLGRKEVMDLFGPNEMTSTHTGNPVCVAAALANLQVIENEKLIENAMKLEKSCREFFDGLQLKYANIIGRVNGVGLAWGVVFIKNDGSYDTELAHKIVRSCVEKGLLLFAPVGHGSTIKVVPPLVITKEALLEGLSVFEEAIKENVEESISFYRI